ncbi:hypothetical protein D9613_010474 [Agrocybe pediades]|uniref:Uncharacterized protein n=1 Tax=Agrocybe pediades TaxID=84607 RepID=A0A8H4QGI1_9AGAR|nr:hypothetical protein D9613_010474 [Agrocybe pediades]
MSQVSDQTTPRQDTNTLLPSSERQGVSEEVLNALETYKKKDTTKVGVRFRGVGNAPIMR